MKKPIFFSKAMFVEYKKMYEDLNNIKLELISARHSCEDLEKTIDKQTKEHDEVCQQYESDIQALQDAHDQLVAANKADAQKIEELQATIEQLQSNPYNIDNLKKNEGWFILTGSYEGSAGVQVSMDWSDDFINSLYKANIIGDSDDEIVRKWLLLACEQVIDDLEGRIIENTSANAGHAYV